MVVWLIGLARHAVDASRPTAAPASGARGAAQHFTFLRQDPRHAVPGVFFKHYDKVRPVFGDEIMNMNMAVCRPLSPCPENFTAGFWPIMDRISSLAAEAFSSALRLTRLAYFLQMFLQVSTISLSD
jgi:hypothetical protein